MKVIRVDCLPASGKGCEEKVVAGPGLELREAKKVAGEKNADPGRSRHVYFMVVADDYPGVGKESL